MTMITKPCLKCRSVFKAVFSVGKNKVDTNATPFETHRFFLQEFFS